MCASPRGGTYQSPDELLPNLRDLGGLPTVDGRTIRPGLLFRSDGLQRLQPGDRERVVGALALRTLVDLRSDLERERTGGADLTGAVVHHVPILDGSYLRVASEGLRLADMLDTVTFDDTPSLAEAVELLGAPRALPGLVFCTAGKDRTGILVALLLDSIGVRREAVLADFARSEVGMARIMEAFRSNFGDGELPDIPREMMTAPPELLAALLDRVDDRAGSPRDLLLGAGVAEATLDRLGSSLLGT